MDTPLKLAIVLHNHQPVGNLPFVLADAYRDAYEPMLSLIERHSSLRFVCHYTGPLLKWMESEHPIFLDRLAAMAARSQIEMLGGGLYEPILAVIPDADKHGQLLALAAWLERRLHLRPRGAWLAERVWEPHLPAHLARAGLDYTILDDEHFASAGLDPALLDGYYITEDQGEVVRLFPASTSLRYLIPWRDVDEVIRFLRSRHDAGQNLIVFADDGEKFGSWPGTHRHCHEAGWLERLFGAIEANRDWLQTTTLTDYAGSHLPTGRLYVPTGSYHEMEEWSLDPAAQRSLREAREAAHNAGLQNAGRFMRAGLWRNFLRRYPESNVLQQRAAAVSRRAHCMPAGEARDLALDHLWQGQCNCPYWHGVFGGIYMYHIRHETFRHVIAADALADSIPAGIANADLGDYDADGRDEARLASCDQAVYVSAIDGAVYEWDLRGHGLNLCNTLASHAEAYAADTGTSTQAPRPRHTFAEMLHHSSPDPAAWAAGTAVDLADTGSSRLSLTHTESEVAVTASRHVSIDADGRLDRLSLAKTIAMAAGDAAIAARYRVRLETDSPRPLYLSVEVCLALPPGAHVVGSADCEGDRRGLMEVWGKAAAQGFALDSGGTQRLSVTGEWSPAAQFATHPLLSSHRTEHGEEHVYQGTRVIITWPLPARPGETWEASVRLGWRAGST